jgi:dienelactone hydrolase
MLSKILLTTCLLLLSSLSPLPTQNTDEELITAARAFVDLLAKKDFAAAFAQFDDNMKTAMPQAKLEEIWNALQAQVGPFQQQGKARTEKHGAYTMVYVTSSFKNMPLDIKVVFDNTKKVTGLFVVPVTNVDYSAPGYVKPDSFREHEVTIGKGEWILPGTLSVPTGTGPFPAVVLVHGSGPNDRDESVGPNKPFRDLAGGLASQGIAVLRYEKRTREHAMKLATIKNFSVQDEVVDDALAAVELLKKTEGVDKKKIFVVGHSLGGMLAPRIGAGDQSIAGLVLLAGGTRPLEDIIPQQYEYIFSLDKTVTPEEQKQLDEAKASRVKVKALTKKDKDSKDLVFGAPPSYWLDLRDYDPPQVAHGLKQPLLILQGERDYQVTMQDFGAWKSALGARGGVTFKSYPALNHLFITGSGKSIPSEYDRLGHVDETVISDIANWIKSL